MIKPNSPGRTELGQHQLSYAAGSTSLEPYGFRILGQSDNNRLDHLLSSFPELSRLLHREALIISAYPAALGLAGFAPLVDTYLHPPTFIRAMRLAAIEDRSVVFAAQPLAGVDLLLRAIHQQMELPQRMLWAAGGYYFPRSLEVFITDCLAQQGCQIEYLHCYGVAEIGHTCFAAMERFDSGHPRFRKVAPEVTASVIGGNSQLALQRSDGRSIVTEDYADEINGEWLIQSGHGRMCPEVREQLESWSHQDWMRRTGYLAAQAKNTRYQLREWVECCGDERELRYFRFWEQHGGSLQCKPKWNRASASAVTPPSGPHPVPHRI
ncbi:hypothetical protein Pla52o_07590 [Novipirellula galeiformis]|uniref:Uncharacterized protein n=1 Tax=Novipirellula galeiformis TaxID=2528004 RepID=A0A5C6CPJ3_9BACT|nr:hypothetical protein [Novipirellula galeiformis]TWU26903.1 hypothetical protein Pla52o_07590 [Novipirellula galeiformis]